MSMRKLKAWHEAGLIDDQTLARIEAYEGEHARPLALWGAIGIGSLAIGLGIISVIAANWEDVLGQVRLAVHFALMAGLGTYLGLRGDHLSERQPWVMEAALFILAMLGMTFFGHLGQVYQTGSPLWQPLAAWLLLFAPLLLWRGQSWLTALLLIGTFAFTCWDYTFAADRSFGREEDFPELRLTIITTLPILFAPLGAWMRERSSRIAFWKRNEQLGLAYAVGGVSLTAIFAGIEEFDESILAIEWQLVRAAMAILAGGMIYAARQIRSGEASAGIMAGSGIVAILAYAISGDGLSAGILFMLLWAGIGFAALRAQWRSIFQIAVAVVALRLIILSFELASDLLTSGFGLIIAGAMILGIAWGALRISRKYAPSAEGAE
jgi:hypothetical protein